MPEKDVHKIQDERIDRTWTTTWFAPRIGRGAADSVYNVMVRWGVNYGASDLEGQYFRACAYYRYLYR